MKKLILFRSFVFALSLFLSLEAVSQWQSDVRLTNDEGSSLLSSHGRSVAASGDTIIAVWRDNRSGPGEITCVRSTNGGNTWTNSEKIAGANGLELSNPMITVYQKVFYVIYKQNSFSIQLSKSTNAGVTWSGSVVNSGSDGFNRYDPCIAVSGNNVHAAWVTDVSGTKNLSYRMSTNGGETFLSLVSWLPSGGNIIASPSITVNESTVLLVYESEIPAKLHYTRSTNSGASWLALNIPSGSSIEADASTFANGQNFYIAWCDYRNGNGDIYCRRSTNSGLTWYTETRLTTHASDQENPSIFASGTNVHLTWMDYRDSTEIYYLKGTNNGNTWGTAIRLTENVYSSLYPSVTAAGNKVHVVWSDRRFDNRYEVLYKRNLTGNVGMQNISTEIPSAFLLEQNYPNPFNPVTKIQFQVPLCHSGVGRNPVKLLVFDILGKEVATLVNESLQPGTYETTFDASNLNSGIYFYRLSAGDFTETKKLLLIK